MQSSSWWNRAQSRRLSLTLPIISCNKCDDFVRNSLTLRCEIRWNKEAEEQLSIIGCNGNEFISLFICRFHFASRPIENTFLIGLKGERAMCKQRRLWITSISLPVQRWVSLWIFSYFSLSVFGTCRTEHLKISAIRLWLWFIESKQGSKDVSWTLRSLLRCVGGTNKVEIVHLEEWPRGKNMVSGCPFALNDCLPRLFEEGIPSHWCALKGF